jgi:hypothetical protein
MKVSIKNLLLILLALSVPISAAIGQDKKTEKKIKVIIDDGSGSKTVIDTTFTNSPLPDSVILKNGRVIYFAGSGKEEMTGKSPEKVLVTVTSTGSDEKNKEQTVIVTSDDATWNQKVNDGEKTYNIRIKHDDNDSETEMTKYVIAKDGVVVTVESNDEAKAKDLIKEIENKLGVNKEENQTKEIVKTETRKTVKK